MTPAQLTNKQMLGVISALVEKWGTQNSVAARLDITPAYLSDIRAERREISEKVARKLGYRREVVFTKEKERT